MPQPLQLPPVLPPPGEFAWFCLLQALDHYEQKQKTDFCFNSGRKIYFSHAVFNNEKSRRNAFAAFYNSMIILNLEFLPSELPTSSRGAVVPG